MPSQSLPSADSGRAVGAEQQAGSGALRAEQRGAPVEGVHLDRLRRARRRPGRTRRALSSPASSLGRASEVRAAVPALVVARRRPAAGSCSARARSGARSSPTSSRPSPRAQAERVPGATDSVAPSPSAAAGVRAAGIAFHAARASSASDVSNVCGSSPWPGTDCTGVPAGTSTTPGAPGASSTSNAISASAATPGPQLVADRAGEQAHRPELGRRAQEALLGDPLRVERDGVGDERPRVEQRDAGSSVRARRARAAGRAPRERRPHARERVRVRRDAPAAARAGAGGLCDLRRRRAQRVAAARVRPSCPTPHDQPDAAVLGVARVAVGAQHLARGGVDASRRDLARRRAPERRKRRPRAVVVDVDPARRRGRPSPRATRSDRHSDWPNVKLVGVEEAAPAVGQRRRPTARPELARATSAREVAVGATHTPSTISSGTAAAAPSSTSTPASRRTSSSAATSRATAASPARAATTSSVTSCAYHEPRPAPARDGALDARVLAGGGRVVGRRDRAQLACGTRAARARWTASSGSGAAPPAARQRVRDRRRRRPAAARRGGEHDASARPARRCRSGRRRRRTWA